MTGTVAEVRWAEPWRYDARDRTTRPELCPVFVEPPPRAIEEPDDVDLDDIPMPVATSLDGPYLGAIRLGPPRTMYRGVATHQ